MSGLASATRRTSGPVPASTACIYRFNINAQFTPNERFFHALLAHIGDPHGVSNHKGRVMPEPDTAPISQRLLTRAKCVLAAHGDLRVVLAAAAIVDADDAGMLLAKISDIDAVEAAADELGLEE